MDRVLVKLERIFGRLAIERFASLLVAGMGVVFVLRLVNQRALANKLALVPQLVPHEPWRLLTFAFYPVDQSPIFTVFTLMFTYWVGSSLEASWGAFKLNVYYLIGMLGVIGAAFLTGEPQSNQFLNESMFFALATLAPEVEVMLFVIPVKMKWLALFALVFIGMQFLDGDMAERVGILVSFANYGLFFAGHLVTALGGRKLATARAQRRSSAPPKKSAGRSCAICGARQEDGADIRVCSCEKCGGKSRDLCLAHAREH